MVDMIKKDDGDKGAGDSKSTTLEIDGKQYGVDDIKNLQAQQASATQKTQEVAAIKKHIDGLGLTVEEYVAESERVYGGVAELVRDGIIDEKLIAVPVVEDPNKGKGPAQPFDWGNMGGGGGNDVKPDAGSKAMESINTQLKGQNETIKQLQENNAMLLRVSIAGQIVRDNEDLSQADAEYIIDASTSDSSKSMSDHIAAYKDRRSKVNSDQEVKFAKKFGINIEEFNANQLKEQNAKGGAGGTFQGKKFMFGRRKKKGDDSVTPKNAMISFIDTVRRQEG